MGTESVVSEGGTQLMQTGSGVAHSEALKEPSETFQIWFEPQLTKAIQRTPTYFQYREEEFPIYEQDGITIKTVLGGDSPMKIVTDAQMWDVHMDEGSIYRHILAGNRTLAGLAIEGNGSFFIDGNKESLFDHKDFVIFQSDELGEVTFHPREGYLHIYLIEVPTEVEYRLFRKAK